MNTDDLPEYLPWHGYPPRSLIFHDTLRDNYSNAATCKHSAHLPHFTATSCQHSPSCFSCDLPDCTWPS